jgi:hypothetical protein
MVRETRRETYSKPPTNRIYIYREEREREREEERML